MVKSDVHWDVWSFLAILANDVNFIARSCFSKHGQKFSMKLDLLLSILELNVDNLVRFVSRNVQWKNKQAIINTSPSTFKGMGGI